jgi:hypothetical protein
MTMTVDDITKKQMMPTCATHCMDSKNEVGEAVSNNNTLNNVLTNKIWTIFKLCCTIMKYQPTSKEVKYPRNKRIGYKPIKIS